MTSFTFEPIYGSIPLAALIAIVIVAVLWWITPPTENGSHRRWLIILRCAAAMVLLLILFRPAILRTDNQPAEAALVVAADVSRSMSLPDGDGRSRWETQKQVWDRIAGSLTDLDSYLDLRLIVYDETARAITSASPGSLDSQAPEGNLTDLSIAANFAIQSAEGRPLAGIILIGDGTQTAPLAGSGAQRVAETLSSLGVPLWTIPIGPVAGSETSREIAVDALPESYQLFAGNEVAIDFQVHSRGLKGITLPLRLSWIDLEGKVTEVASRSIVPAAASDIASLSIPVLAPPPGVYQLKVEAEPQQGELVTANNVQIAFVDVREGGGRILFLEGAARLEQTFLRRSLRRFPDLDLNFRWIPGDTSGQWPIDLAEDLQPGKFDVFMIGDLNAAAIGESQLSLLAARVAEGAGLVTLGGFQAYDGGGYDTSPLADVLPVIMGAKPAAAGPAANAVNQGLINQASVNQIPGPLELRPSIPHSITDFGGADPGAIWRDLPPLLGANRWVGPKVAPGVTVLLESPDGLPLLVTGEYGRGRVAAIAFDSTWRWWKAGKSESHRRFWRQLILWLLSREGDSEDKILIEMDSRRFAVDKPAAFHARVDALGENALGENASPIELIAEIVDNEGNATPVATSTVLTGEGSASTTIQGRIPTLRPGIHRLRVSPKQPSESISSEEVAFQVIDESRELAQPMADPVYLRQLAGLTARHGGGAYTADDVDSLINKIRQLRREAEMPVVEKFRLGDDPFSAWILFAWFATALTVEWFLRRRWGLA